MEKDQEFRHVCKFCSKSFLCGRSLGGHMRSHMINDVSSLTDGTKITRKKLPPLINSNSNGANNNDKTGTETAGYYGLRDNPKKNWRVSDHSSCEDTTSVLDKYSCKECCKKFKSWKALFGHMKCHSVPDKERLSNNTNSLEEEQQDSWASANNQKLVMDSQSDNETAAPNRRKRSKRRLTRYMAATNSSSLSFANNASSSVSEIEQEQEEVAMCLMMLSRDVRQWGGGLNSFAESSDNNSVFMEANGKSEIDKAEFSASANSRQGILKNKMGKKLTQETALDQTELASNVYSSRKRKFCDLFDAEKNSESLKKKLTSNALDSEDCKNSDRSSKFECTTCNKVFHSYQALGGHRASHKNPKDCFSSRIDHSSENSIETEIFPPDPTTADCVNNGETSYEAKKSKGHECAVCLKVFPSGQALGGHKRSHLVAGGMGAKHNKTIEIQEPIPAIRDFLDLNLPAPIEEQSSNGGGGGGLVGINNDNNNNPLWINANNHKRNTLVGLISN